MCISTTDRALCIGHVHFNTLAIRATQLMSVCKMYIHHILCNPLLWWYYGSNVVAVIYSSEDSFINLIEVTESFNYEEAYAISGRA